MTVMISSKLEAIYIPLNGLPISEDIMSRYCFSSPD